MTQDTRPTARALRTGLAGSAPMERGAHLCVRSPEHDYGGPGPEVLAASACEGNTVVNAQGDYIGEIEEVMIDVCGGRVAYAVVSIGDFLGTGEKYLAVPWRALTLDTDNEQFILDVESARMKKAPAFHKEDRPSMSDSRWAHEIHSYYGIRPYWER